MSDFENATTDVQAALEAGITLADPTPLERSALYSLALPADGKLEIVDTEKWGATPGRLRATYRPATVEALAELITRFIEVDETTVWVHPTSGRIVAIFNDNDGKNGTPGWRDHRAELQLQHTPEWNHWMAQDGRLLPQRLFAEHIEEGLLEIVAPVAAEMLELAQTIEMVESANFRSAIRVENNIVQAKYEQTVDTKAGQSGQLTIPSEIKLGLQPFVGAPKYEATARFRWKLSAGSLSMGYKIDRPDAILRTALTDAAEQLRQGFAALPVLSGEPA